MRVTKSGDSLTLILPPSTADALNAKEGDEVSVVVSRSERKLEVFWTDKHTRSGGAEATSFATSTESREEALRDLRRFRGLIPAEYKFDRRDAYAARG